MKSICHGVMNLYKTYCFKEYNFMRYATKTRNQRRFLYVITFPILVIKGIFTCILENTVGYVMRSLVRDSNVVYPHDFAIVAIVKNETLYIKEWIEYHKLVGCSKFYIYDNGSVDGLKDLLEDYIQIGQVEYIFIPGRAKQLDAYNDSIRRFKRDVKYMAFIDIDEFIVPTNNTPIISIVDSIMSKYKKAGGVAINWYVYGSGGHVDMPRGLVCENFLYRAEDNSEVNKCVKTICNPRRIKGFIFDPHTPTYKSYYKSVNENGYIIDGPWNTYPNNSYSMLRINHYYCKSKEECKIKFDRGLATHEKNIKRKWEEFIRFDRNEVYDDIMLRYVDQLKINLENGAL